MIEYETIPAAQTVEHHLDRYIGVLSRLLIEDYEISLEPPETYPKLRELVRHSIFTCYIYLSENGHEGLAKAFVEGRRREGQLILTK